MSRWMAAASLALVAAAFVQAQQQPFELLIVQYQSPINGNQAYYNARVKEVAELVRSQSNAGVLLLNTGGAGYKPTSSEGLQPAATALSMADFEGGVEGLRRRLLAEGEPFVAANLRAANLGDNLAKSVVYRLGEQKIGVVGYVSEYLNLLLAGQEGAPAIISEVAAVREEAVRLHRAGVQIIIALGSGGHESNVKVAQQVPGLDAVVSGPSEVSGTFPQTIVTQRNVSVPLLEMPAGDDNKIGVTRLVFDSRYRVIAGSGVTSVISEDATDKLEAKVAALLRVKLPGAASHPAAADAKTGTAAALPGKEAQLTSLQQEALEQLRQSLTSTSKPATEDDELATPEAYDIVWTPNGGLQQEVNGVKVPLGGGSANSGWGLLSWLGLGGRQDAGTGGPQQGRPMNSGQTSMWNMLFGTRQDQSTSTSTSFLSQLLAGDSNLAADINAPSQESSFLDALTPNWIRNMMQMFNSVDVDVVSLGEAGQGQQVTAQTAGASASAGNGQTPLAVATSGVASVDTPASGVTGLLQALTTSTFYGDSLSVSTSTAGGQPATDASLWSRRDYAMAAGVGIPASALAASFILGIII